MRHHVSQKKLGRKKGQRDMLLNSMARSLIIHGHIDTTLARAKALRPHVEKLVTVAQGGTLAARRNVAEKLGQGKILSKLIDEVAPRFKERPGGYTRIIKLPSRKGDSSSMARIEFVD